MLQIWLWKRQNLLVIISTAISPRSRAWTQSLAGIAGVLHWVSSVFKAVFLNKWPEIPFSCANFLSFISWVMQDWQGACYLRKWSNRPSLLEQRPSETSELTWLTQAKSLRNLSSDAAETAAKSFRDRTGDLWPEPLVSVLDANLTHHIPTASNLGKGARMRPEA